jgi:Na+-driven multidrug efflux pump
MIISFIANWPVKILMAYITTYILGMSIDAVWYAVALSIVIEGLGLYFWYKKGLWLDRTSSI